MCQPLEMYEYNQGHHMKIDNLSQASSPLCW